MVLNPRQFESQQMSMDLANQLVARNVPIENIIQQTGLPRETVNNLVNAQLAQLNISRPSMPMSSPQGINSLQGSLQPDVADVVPNVGTDIADYLTEELGFDPEAMANPNIDITSEDLTTKQNLNIANAEVMVEDPSQVDILLANQKALSGETDENVVDVYKRALAEYSGVDYKSLIPLPDKDFAIMMAGLKLAEAGSKGEKWGTALTQAVTTGLTQYASDKRNYQKQILGIDLESALQTDKVMKDFIGKQIDYAQKLKNEELTGARKQYMVTVPGTDEGTVLQLNSVQVGNLQGGGYSLMEYDASKTGALKNYTVTYNNGVTETGALTEAQALKYNQDKANGIIKNIEVAGATSSSDDFGVLTRAKNAPPGTNFTFDYTSKTGLTDLINNPDLEVIPLKDAGGSYEVIDKQDNTLKKIPAIQYFANADQYKLKRGLTGSIVSPDGTMISFDSDGSGFSSMNANSTGKAVEKVVEQVRSRKFLTNEVNRLAGNTIDSIMGMENPDLAFNNLAGRGIDTVKSALTNLNAISGIFSKPVVRNQEGDIVKGFTFSYKNPKGEIEKGLSFNQFRNKVIQSDFFREFEKSPLGQFITSSNIDRGVAQSQLFTLALVGAAAAGGSADLDLRAISDKDMELFMTRVGAKASNAGQFMAIVNQFREDIIETELNYLNSMLDMPITQMREAKNPETGEFEVKKVDLFEERGIYKQRNERIEELNAELEKIRAMPRLNVLDDDYAVSNVGSLKVALEPMGGVSPTTPIPLTVPGVQNPSYEQVVGYIFSLSDLEARNYLNGIEQTYGKRNPTEYNLLLNFYKQAKGKMQ